jgi:hypothetical protein
LKAFIALVGMREAGEPLRQAVEDLGHPSRMFSALGRLGGSRLKAWTSWPDVAVTRIELRGQAAGLARRVKKLAGVVERTLMRWSARHDLFRHPENIVTPQFDQERIADAAIALVTAACTLSRIDRSVQSGSATEWDRAAADLYLRIAFRTYDRSIGELTRNDDSALTRAAEASLGRYAAR